MILDFSVLNQQTHYVETTSYERHYDVVPTFCSCWVLTCFIFVLQGVFLFYAIQFEPVKYNTYEYPGWAHGVGILMALSSVGIIPCYMIYLYIVTPGNTMQVSL